MISKISRFGSAQDQFQEYFILFYFLVVKVSLRWKEQSLSLMTCYVHAHSCPIFLPQITSQTSIFSLTEYPFCLQSLSIVFLSLPLGPHTVLPSHLQCHVQIIWDCLIRVLGHWNTWSSCLMSRQHRLSISVPVPDLGAYVNETYKNSWILIPICWF